MKIVLLGYMASGKSAIGKQLSKLMAIKFLDLDDVIEAELGCTIAETFKTKGEVFFRKKESEVLNKVLTSDDNFVLATGGGTPCFDKNMELILLNSTYSFYLQLPISELVRRIEKEADHRPLVREIPTNELPEFIAKHLFERSFFYSQARATIACGTKTIDEIAEEIQVKLL